MAFAWFGYHGLDRKGSKRFSFSESRKEERSRWCRKTCGQRYTLNMALIGVAIVPVYPTPASHTLSQATTQLVAGMDQPEGTTGLHSLAWRWE